ncbi:acyltransferase [Phytomonospora sp. NPDC050363]|uniref:acyltransferase n=1 Tax=Phytomonospora sp. NPDC050363 TaxID=3155642 RepID=UPI0033D8796A
MGTGTDSGGSLTSASLPYEENHFDFSPWSFWESASPEERARQLELQAALRSKRGYVFGADCFVSPLAAIQNDRLRLGDRSYIAAGAYLSGDITMGDDATINPYTVVRGEISIGDGVRIGAHTSIIAFNHDIGDPEATVISQGITARGITVGDDVWVGSHVIVLDGVRVGSHSVLAAGAVVTKDVPAGAIVGGNPARVLKWRVPRLRPDSTRDGLGEAVAAFAGRARREATTLLDRRWNPATARFADRPGVQATVRAQCDAVEIADLLLGGPPEQLPAEEQVARLRSWQDPASGLVGQLDENDGPLSLDNGTAAYHALSVGYALDLLGSAFPFPISLSPARTPETLVAWLDGLRWSENPWEAGSQIDALGTAMTWNRLNGHGNPTGCEEALLGWMMTRVDPGTGMWGRVDHGDLLPAVNGWYRATRGTFGQFGIPVPYPERVIDTVLRHLHDATRFAPENLNACNVLDIAYPLWITRHTGYRAEEVRSRATVLIPHLLEQWTPNEGFGFAAPSPTAGARPESTPGLQGTEMWLAILWYLCDLAGLSDRLGYRPRGVHNPSPRLALYGGGLRSN